MQFKIEELRQAIEKSGTKKQLIEFNGLNEKLTSLDLLNDKVSLKLFKITTDLKPIYFLNRQSKIFYLHLFRQSCQKTYIKK